MGAARTSHADFHMMLNDKGFFPCMSRVAADGYRVSGEVFYVDDDILAALDLLEKVDEDLYQREQVEVELLDGERQGETIKCQAYIMPIREDLLKLERIPNYTPLMHKTYRSRTKTPNLEVLKCLYGEAVMDAVQSKLNEGMEFDGAWKAVVGA
ncbi:hypothetical protein JG688_00001439 [Phytophthora aleatoria]|uniref:Gamma-glutamylcyclotransferase family protein n=1 Tax=Phytophthora aleatoria TaxID=2496075 RepID=A0A8J5JBK1_9STRA|nr:hypothetical protein JG688_00001439 [Phytophthora aleatoria]